MLFVVPAAIAGYHLTLGLARLGMVSEGWREAFAIVGAVVIGGTAWARVAMLAAPLSNEDVHTGSSQPPLESATTRG
jgi:hypothetical protein